MSEEKFSYWRRVWQITSGNLKSASREEVQSTLFDERNNIISGVVQFKKSDNEVELTDIRAKDIAYFISRTAENLNVSKTTAWRILKSYIVNEYCGSTKTIQNMKYEMQILPMLNNCWRFFTAERMFLIKIMKNIIEFMRDSDHPFSDIYESFVVQVDEENILDALLDEMDYLISEIQSDVAKKMPETLQKSWVQRNMRELIEVCHCLIMFARHADVQISHFHKILSLCKKHGFGNEPLFFDSLKLAEPYLLNKLRYSEVALLLCIANELWMRKDGQWILNDISLTEELDPLAYREEHGAVCYIWITLHLYLRNNSEFDEIYFHKYIKRAVTLQCFQFFYNMFAHEMFQDGESLVGTKVRLALYNMFAISFENIDICNRYFQFVQIALIIAEIIKNNFMCEQYFKETKFAPLWSTAVERYPLEKDILSKLVEAAIISEASVAKDVMDQLLNLPWYTEIYDPSKIHHTQRHNNTDMYTVKLLSDKIITKSHYSFIIPQHSEAIIKKEFGIIYIHYRKDVNYWLIFLAEFNSMLGEPGISAFCESIHLGLKVFLAILKVCPDTLKKNPVYTEIICLVFVALDKYSTYTEEKPLKMLTTCMDICSELLTRYRSFVCSQMETFKLLPTLAKIEFSYEEIFHINFLEPGKLGNLIVRSEREVHHDSFLISYLNFLRSSFIASDGHFETIELPGLVFVLKEIFPHFMLWYARKDRSYLDVLYQIIHFLFEMFQFSSDKLDMKQYVKMRKIAYQCFLNETCGRCLLKILSAGNSGVQNIMEGQTNWRTGRGVKCISVLQKIMSVLIQLLTQKKTVVDDNNGLTPLEHMIYTENDGVHTIQAIASFLNHPFNEIIPNLACRLLKKCTVELQMSMLAALDLEADQIRMMFIQRLRDHLESDEMKLAIIELISASVPKQPGMTEAFFKVSSAVNPSGSNSQTSIASVSSSSSLEAFNEGIGTFLVEYLYAFSSENLAMNSPLLSRIMELLHVLWMHQKEILIADIVKDEQFWPSLCFPLFKKNCMSDKTYSEIFNIIGKEVHKRCGQVDEPLINVLTKLLSPNEPFLDTWLKHIISFNDRKVRLKVEYNMPSCDRLMLSFKDFLIIGIKFLPTNIFPQEVQIKIAEECRINLKEHIFSLNASCMITFLLELYLYLTKNWAESCFKNDIDCYTDVVSIVRTVAVCYRDLEHRFQEALLTLTVLTLRGLKSVAINNPELTKVFSESVQIIFNHEYNIFLEKYNNKQLNDVTTGKYVHQKAFIMCFEALNEMLIIQSSTPGDKYNQCFGQSQLLHKLVDCVRKFIENRNTLPLTKIAIECMIHYASSANTNDFLSSEIDVYLWEKLQIPTILRNPKYIDYVHLENLPLELKEWWLLYRRMIMLMIILLKKHGYFFLNKTLMFVSLHEEYFCEILLLERYTVETTALDLIKVTLMFLYELFKYQKYWRLEHEQSLVNLLDAVKMSLNYSSAVLLRPSVLKCYPSPQQSTDEVLTPDSLPSELLVEVMNKLTDIITLGTYCILEFSPPLYRMLRDDKDYSSWALQVGTNFGLPTFGDNESCELTFGLLFCVASVYVRILQQVSSTKKASHVTSPREILVARKSRQSKSEEIKSNTPPKAEETTTDKESHFNFLQPKRPSRQLTNAPAGFIRIDYLSPTYIISTVENFGSYTSPIKTFPWYAKLSEDKVFRALETVVSLIAAQVSHILYPDSQLNTDARLIKRELSSELQNFHEFIKRRLMETQRYISSERSLFRKKFGLVEDDTSRPNSDTVCRIPSKRSLMMTKKDVSIKSVEDRIDRLSCSTNGLSEVKLITEDYLHLLSVWFSYFLHYE